MAIDSWCNDSLSHPEGIWQPWAGDLEIDTIHFAVGGSSVKIWTNVYNYFVAAAFNLYSGFDTTRSNTLLHFLIALEKDRFTGTCHMALFDINGKGARKTFTVNTLGVWESKDMAMGELSAEAGFDWMHIVNIYLDADQTGAGYPPSGGACWIDQLYFSYDVPDSSLIITSNLPSKNGTYTDDLYGSQPFTTPSEIIRPVGQIGLVQIDVANFDHWEDDPQNINPTRQFTFIPTNMTLTAIYTIQQNPFLVIDSFDQDMNHYIADQGVNIVNPIGTPSAVKVPFGGRIPKGNYSFSYINTAKRTFDHWKMPDGTTSIEKTVEWDIQADTRIEVHWQVTSENGDGGNNNILIIGAVAILAVGGLVFLMTRRKK